MFGGCDQGEFRGCINDGEVVDVRIEAGPTVAHAGDKPRPTRLPPARKEELRPGGSPGPGSCPVSSWPKETGGE